MKINDNKTFYNKTSVPEIQNRQCALVDELVIPFPFQFVMLDEKGAVVQSVKLDSTNQQKDLVPVLHVEQEK